MCTVRGKWVVVLFNRLHLPENADCAALFSALAFQHRPAPQRQETGCRLGIRGVLELGVRPQFAGGTEPGFQQGGRERVGLGGLWIDLRDMHGRGGERTNLWLAGPPSRSAAEPGAFTTGSLRMCALFCCCLLQSSCVKSVSPVLVASHSA